MARFQVTHSDDACCIDIRGDIRRPEPSTAVIRFPGGHVEVSRHSDGSYWVHVGRNVRINDPDTDEIGHVVGGRIDITYAAQAGYPSNVLPMPAAEHIEHLALRIARADPNSATGASTAIRARAAGTETPAPAGAVSTLPAGSSTHTPEVAAPDDRPLGQAAGAAPDGMRHG